MRKYRPENYVRDFWATSLCYSDCWDDVKFVHESLAGLHDGEWYFPNIFNVVWC